MATASGTRNTTIYLHACIIVGIMILAHFIPAPAPITPLGIQIIGIFIGMIWGWCTCGMLWPSIIGIIMLGMTDYAASPEAALGMVLTHNTVISMFVAFIVLAYVNNSGLMNVIAQWLVTRKFAAGRPWLFMSFFFTMLMLIAGVFNGVILIIIAFNFILPVLKDMGYTKEDTLPTYMLLGIALFAGMGTVWPPFLPNSLFTRGILTTALGGVPLSSFQYFVSIDLPLFACFALYLLMGKFVARVDTQKFVAGTEVLLAKADAEEKTPLSSEQKGAALLLTIFILGLALPAILPAAWAPIALLKRFGLIGISLSLTVALLILESKDGKPLADFAHLVTTGVDWNMFFLTGGIMIIAAALTSEGTGIATAMAMYLVPIVSKAPLIAFVAIIIVALCIFSQFSMNMVLQMVFAPILAPILLASGYNPLIAVMAVYFGTQLAFLAPSGSMMAAMVFAKVDWVKPSHIYKICLPWIIVSMAAFIAMSLLLPDLIYHPL